VAALHRRLQNRPRGRERNSGRVRHKERIPEEDGMSDPSPDAEVIRGSCLCGGVRFEIDRAVGPFELCHCSRCRKATGSAFVAGLGVRAADFRLLSGAELIRSFEAPILRRPPAYRVSFCGRCGSPVPDPPPEADWLEIPAGLLDDDPRVTPDRHILVEYLPPWDAIHDSLPRLDGKALVALRKAAAERGGA